MKRRLPLPIWAFVPVLATNAIAQTGDGYIGIFADSAGTVPCTTVPQWTGTTLYVIAKLEGGSAAGITGSEFRIEVENPSGWYITYTPPTAKIILGNALDLEPQDPDDGSGMNIAFDGCREPVGGNIPFGTLTVININGEATRLNVKRHSTPRNPNYACPLFTLCDEPVLSKACMTPSTAACSTLSPSKAFSAGDDAPIFSLELTGESGPMSESGLRARLEDKPSMTGLPASTWKADIVGSVAGYPAKAMPPPSTIRADTVWMDWSFDTGPGCTDADWTKADNRVLNDGSIYWSVSPNHAGTYPAPPEFGVADAVIEGNAAVIAVEDNCFASSPGYANDWDNAIRIKYQGVTSVEFHIALDTEPVFDGVQIELDSLCSCCDQVDYVANPEGRAEDSRRFLGSLWGKDAGSFSFVLDEDDDFNLPQAIHCLLIRFISDREVSPQDRSAARAGWDREAGVIIDKIRTVGGITIDEDFEDWPGGDCNASGNVCFINSADATPFGNWGRLFKEVTDNDLCDENTTCSWLFSDHSTPTLFNDPAMAFGPGGYVLQSWMDDVVFSPWISAPDLGTPKKLVLSFREFPGNNYVNSRISRAWSIRGKKSPVCLPSSWAYESFFFHPLWDDLSTFDWVTQIKDMTPYAARQEWDQIQVRFRIADLRIPLEGQWNKPSPPQPYIPGPGPYIDRVQVGTVTFPGPVIVGADLDSRYQAQDAFPTEIDPQFLGERFRPSTDRFGTSAFSPAADIFTTTDEARAGLYSPGDSIVVRVQDFRDAALDQLFWYGAIVAGPHQGMAPAPYAVGANGFFEVAPDSVRDAIGAVREGFFFVDLDDTYFRGGDVLRYYWWARDVRNVVTSAPPGISADPTSIAEAEAATGGLLEANFLPTIQWAPAYLARLADDPAGHGDLDPTPAELLASEQQNCILYVNRVSPTRRSGNVNRTSFMFTLDRLGYQDKYDVYDVMGFGGTNNDLASRARVEQAQGYALIIHDAGREETLPLATGGGRLGEKVDQASWYQSWLDQAAASEAFTATLWLIGEDLVQRSATHPLLSTDAGATLITSDQGLTVNPNVRGVASMTFDLGSGSNTVNFTGDQFSLNGGCPSVRDYDALGTSGLAVMTHRYQHPGTGQLGAGAVVMNKNAAENWNTIVMAFPWFDVVPFFESQPTTPTPGEVLASKILSNILPGGCLAGTPTDAHPEAEDAGLPRVTALFQNTPNPCNPTTRIEFDLAASDIVELRIFDVTGRLVRTLIKERMERKRHSVVWDGLDETGRPVSSGLYFYRLRSGGQELTRKLVMLK